MVGRNKRTVIGGLAGVAALAIVAAGATSVLGAGDDTPRYGKLTIDLSKEAAVKQQGNQQRSKPRVVYLKSGATTVDPTAIGTPYLDIKLTGCRKVVDGGVLTQDDANHDIYVQGSYVANPGEYHVRIGFDDAAVAAGVHPFTITSHLTCLKGVR
jgi:hypothetical protein